MKRTITINLGGTVFSIDEDAYELLKNYLEKTESQFQNEDEKKEIMADIEARIAELYSQSHASGTRPLTINDVEKVIEIMGDPGDIAGEAEEAGGATGATGSSSAGRRGGRRIYRDVDNRVLGGVCSGMSTYWSIDVVWIRIIFVVLALLFFSGFLVYLLLWLVIPPARTTAQKLEMKGEPVNISSIGKAVKEEFNSVRKNLKI